MRITRLQCNISQNTELKFRVWRIGHPYIENPSLGLFVQYISMLLVRSNDFVTGLLSYEPQIEQITSSSQGLGHNFTHVVRPLSKDFWNPNHVFRLLNLV